MPKTKNYQDLHERVLERPGALERLNALREETLMEIGLYELRRALEISQEDLAAELEISQSAISQLERAGDLKLSTLRKYLKSWAHGWNSLPCLTPRKSERCQYTSVETRHRKYQPCLVSS